MPHQTKELVAGYSMIRVKSREDDRMDAALFAIGGQDSRSGRAIGELEDFGEGEVFDRFREIGIRQPEIMREKEQRRCGFMSMVKSETQLAPPPKAFLEAMDGLIKESAEAGCVMVEAGGLFPTANGARVRLSGGKVTVTDGPSPRPRRWSAVMRFSTCRPRTP